MSKRSKTGRGALVRRLRREYGISEQDARIAAEGGGWRVDDPDVVAARFRERARSRADELKRALPETDFTGWRSRVCPQRPAGWCLPDWPRPEQPRAPSHRPMRAAGLLGMIAALGVG